MELKRDAFKEWLYRKKDDVSTSDEFSKYSTAGSAILLTERFDLIAWWSLPDVRESLPTLHRGPLIHSPVQQHPANASEPLAAQRSSYTREEPSK